MSSLCRKGKEDKNFDQVTVDKMQDHRVNMILNQGELSMNLDHIKNKKLMNYCSSIDQPEVEQNFDRQQRDDE